MSKWCHVALVCLMVVCADRAPGGDSRYAGTVQDALIGHWMSESGGVEYYIDRASLVMVEGLTRKNMTYTVVASDEKGNSIKIYVAADRQHGHEKSLVFDADRRGLTETIQVKISYGRSLIPIKFSRSHSSRWIYVGSDRAP